MKAMFFFSLVIIATSWVYSRYLNEDRFLPLQSRYTNAIGDMLPQSRPDIQLYRMHFQSPLSDAATV
jgi:hypothetical protein